MSVNTPEEMANYLKTKKNVLLVTGSLCDEVELGGRRLLDYAADIAKGLKLPVAATANTAKGLRAREVGGVKKMWAAELVNYLRSPWQDSIMPSKPEVLVFLGYGPEVARRLVSAVKSAETVVLGNRCVDEATHSLADTSLAGWEKALGELVKALG